MAFKTDRVGWNYTNRGYPTTYSGKIFINKEDFAIVKVIQHWETTLNQDEIKIHFEEYEGFDDKKEYKSKNEIICTYSKMLDQKYYATNYYERTYSETTDLDDSLNNSIRIVNSFLFDIETENVVEIDFYYRKKEPGIDKIKYDADFWESFDIDGFQNSDLK
jgi:hypothetical protein